MSSLHRTIGSITTMVRAGRAVTALTACGLALAACDTGEAAKSASGAPGTDSAALASDSGRAATPAAAGAGAVPAGQTPQAAQGVLTASPAVRALYVNRFAAQSTKRMRKLIDVAERT